MPDDGAEHRRPRESRITYYMRSGAIPSLRAPIPGSLFLNLHVVADKK